MATALTIFSERWLDEVLLGGVLADGAAGDSNEELSLPSGIGDVAILELLVLVEGITTIVSDAILGNLGFGAMIVSKDGASDLDFVGVNRLYRLHTGRVRGCLQPDPLVLWRQDEKCFVALPDLETTATGDIYYRVKVVRIRQPEPAPQPIQLVKPSATFPRGSFPRTTT